MANDKKSIDKHQQGRLRFFRIPSLTDFKYVWEVWRNKDLQVQLDMESAVKELEGWRINDSSAEVFYKLTRESLDEVIRLTEYQDAKATRLLTVNSFIGAIVGVLFVYFKDLYPIGVVQSCFRSNPHHLFLGFTLSLTYMLFFLYAIYFSAGAMVIFFAIRTRFAIPKMWNDSDQPSPPKSRLFYSLICSVTPKAWARSFRYNDFLEKEPDLLLTDYVKNHIIETYLVAHKVKDKIRLLEPGQRLLFNSIRIMLMWFAIQLIIISLSLFGAFGHGKTTPDFKPHGFGILCSISNVTAVSTNTTFAGYSTSTGALHETIS